MDTQLNLFLDNEKISIKKCFNPHKYILLLSIAYLYDMNAYHENKFYLDELIDVFNQILEEFFEKNSYPKNAIEYLFFYLINNKFWFLKINYGKEDAYNEVIKNIIHDLHLIESEKLLNMRIYLKIYIITCGIKFSEII